MPSTLRNKTRRLGYLLPLLLGTALLAQLSHAQQLQTKFDCNMTRDEDDEKLTYGDTSDDPQAEVQRDGDKLHVIPSYPALCSSRRNFTELSFDLKTGKRSYAKKIIAEQSRSG